VIDQESGMLKKNANKRDVERKLERGASYGDGNGERLNDDQRVMALVQHQSSIPFLFLLFFFLIQI
jgi:hypothetical protein